MKRFWNITGCLLLALVGPYFGCYFSLVQRHVASGFTLDGHHGLFFTYPGYRGGGKATEAFFAPAYWFDQRVRTRFWAEMTESDSAPANPSSSEVP